MKNKDLMSKAGYIKWIEDISFFYQKSMSLLKVGKAVWTRGLLITNTLQEPSTKAVKRLPTATPRHRPAVV